MFLPLNIYMVVASQLLGVAADQVPTYDFGQNCHSIATLNNSIERCANDEEDAHGKLRTLWADFSAADKERCETVTRAAWPSYVELLACLQIAQATNGIGARSSDDDKKPGSPAAQEVIDRAGSALTNPRNPKSRTNSTRCWRCQTNFAATHTNASTITTRKRSWLSSAPHMFGER